MVPSGGNLDKRVKTARHNIDNAGTENLVIINNIFIHYIQSIIMEESKLKKINITQLTNEYLKLKDFRTNRQSEATYALDNLVSDD